MSIDMLKGGRREKGQTLVEFALIILLLMILLFGITEFGRAWYYTNTLINGVRDGARYASNLPVDSGYENDVRDYTLSLMTSVIPAGEVTVTVTPSFNNISTGTAVTVQADYTLEILTGKIVGLALGEEFAERPLTRTATMRYQ